MRLLQKATVVVSLVTLFIVGTTMAEADPPSTYKPVDNWQFHPVQIAADGTASATPAPTPIAWMPPIIRPSPLIKRTPKSTHPLIAIPEKKPKPQHHLTVIASRGRVRGTATWYCLPGVSVCPWMASVGNYGAAGPVLRAALGGGDHCKPGPHCWRNRVVIVSGNGATPLAIKLIDWCACGGSHVIDLFAGPMGHFVGANKYGVPLRGGFSATVTW